MKSEAKCLSRRDLGRAGIDYVRRQVADGHRLGAAMALFMRTQVGESFAYLPSDLPNERVMQFTVGGLGESEETRRARDELVINAITTSATRSPVRCVLFAEDRNARGDDPGLDEGPAPFVVAGNCIYYKSPIAEDERDRILQVLNLARDYPMVAVVAPEPRPGASDKTIGDDQIERIAQSALLVIVDAYDLEAEVFWQARP